MPALSVESDESVFFTFSQVSSALAYAHRIAPEYESAFRYRLKNYQKQGWPEGLNTGRGRAANYSIGHIAQLVLALQLNELGMPPEKAIKVLDGNRHRWSVAVSHMAGVNFHGSRYHQFVVIDPSGLDDLRSDVDPDRSELTMHYFGPETLKKAIGKWAEADITRYAVINITSAFEPIFAHLSQWASEKGMLIDLKAWAEDKRSTPPDRVTSGRTSLFELMQEPHGANDGEAPEEQQRGRP